MKFYVLRSRLLKCVLQFLQSDSKLSGSSGDRCLQLAALRFLRSILAVKDEFYHRHIIRHNLFAPVFEAFRANPIGDNLVSSSIIEMCDFIRTENIKSLLEYIATKHLSRSASQELIVGHNHPSQIPSLEEVASPYVDTLTQLRKQYEENLSSMKPTTDGSVPLHSSETDENSSLIRSRVGLSVKAIEDQVNTEILVIRMIVLILACAQEFGLVFSTTSSASS